MFYRVLGDLEIGVSGSPVTLPSGRGLLVLVALLLNANRRMSKTELLRAAWGQVEVGEAQVPKAALVIRDLLRPLGRGEDIKTHSGYGYELRIAESDLDLLLFSRHIRQADEARGTDGELDHLRSALALWRGPRPLANVPGESFAVEIGQLAHRRMRAAVRRFDLEIARGGDFDRLGAELEQIAGHHPEDQRLCEQLMVVAYRSGHPTDAVRAYERHAAAVEAQMEARPGAELRVLAYAASNNDAEPFAAAIEAIRQRAGTPTRAAAPPAVPRQLPPDPPNLVGRTDLVAEATWLLGRRSERNCPVVVVTGPGGIGKTTMARRVAHLSQEHYPDGQLFMEMRGTSDEPLPTGEILAQFLRAFDASVPETVAERLSTFRTLLATRRVLIVLDDASSAAQIRDLIPANPGCGVVVTSRRRLPDLMGAHHMPTLEPLEPDAATDLFTGIVADAGISLRSEAEAVDRVVALCAGLPLALQIAAALRVRDHPRPTAELADRLAQHGPDALAYEESSVAVTIGAGFDRLDQPTRGLLLGLSLSRLPAYAVWTATALLGPAETDPVRMLSRLVTASLLEPVEADGSYRMHDLTRAYSRRRAEAEVPAQDRTALLARTYQALLTLTRYAHAAIYGGDYEVVHSEVEDWAAPRALLVEISKDPAAWVAAERRNIRAAVEHCAELGLTDICWDLAVSAHELYTVGGYYDDWHATSSTALQACRRVGDRRGEAVMLSCLGQPSLVASRAAAELSSVADLEHAVTVLAEFNDRHGLAIALRTLANALRRRGQLNRPLRLFTEALSYYEASGDLIGRLLTLRFIGHTYLDLERHEQAIEVLRSAEALATDLDSDRVVAQVRYWLGRAHLELADLAAAEAIFSAILAAFPEPTSMAHAYAQHGLADVALRTGAFNLADQRLAVAAELAAQTDATLEGRVQVSLAALHRARGRTEDAVSALEHAVSCFGDGGAVYFEARTLAALAEAYAEIGADGEAAEALARVDGLYAAMALPEEDRRRS